MSSERYRDDYLNNVIEAVKVITDDKMRRFNEIIEKRPRIYLIAKGLSEDVARYFYRLFGSLEFDVFLPIQEHEIRSMIRNISSEDLLLVFSYCLLYTSWPSGKEQAGNPNPAILSGSGFRNAL